MSNFQYSIKNSGEKILNTKKLRKEDTDMGMGWGAGREQHITKQNIWETQNETLEKNLSRQLSHVICQYFRGHYSKIVGSTEFSRAPGSCSEGIDLMDRLTEHTASFH